LDLKLLNVRLCVCNEEMGSTLSQQGETEVNF